MDVLMSIIAILSLVVSIVAYKNSKYALEKTDEYNYNEFYRYIESLSDEFELIVKNFRSRDVKDNLFHLRGEINPFKGYVQEIRGIDKVPKDYFKIDYEIIELINSIQNHLMEIKIMQTNIKIEATESDILKEYESIEYILSDIEVLIDKVRKKRSLDKVGP